VIPELIRHGIVVDFRDICNGAGAKEAGYLITLKQGTDFFSFSPLLLRLPG